MAGETLTNVELRFFSKATGATPNNLDTCRIRANDVLTMHFGRDRFIGMFCLPCGSFSVEEENVYVKMGYM